MEWNGWMIDDIDDWAKRWDVSEVDQTYKGCEVITIPFSPSFMRLDSSLLLSS
jgi:hypothetical protein